MNLWTLWTKTHSDHTNDLSNQNTGGQPILVPQSHVPIMQAGMLEPARVFHEVDEVATLREVLVAQAKEIDALQEQMSVIYLRCVFCGDERERDDGALGLACPPCTTAVAYTRKKMFEEAKEVFMEISREIAEL